jgi:thioredoxin-like negative regulator of GroEL
VRLPVSLATSFAGKKGVAVAEDTRPLLIFFSASHSGPARRMESLMAHLARKERARLRVTAVDVEEQPELAERFRIRTVPTLALVKGKRVVERLEGRASAPRIERMLAPHLAA